MSQSIGLADGTICRRIRWIESTTENFVHEAPFAIQGACCIDMSHTKATFQYSVCFVPAVTLIIAEMIV